MNLPNKLSLLRVCLVPLMVALMYPANDLCRLLAAAVFGIASFTDFLDGYLARKHHLVTDFGKFVDPLADKLLVLCALIMMCHKGLMFSWVVCLILGRELAVDGLRMIAVGKGQVIAAGKLGKLKTVSQIVLVLWQLVLNKPLFTAPFDPMCLPGLILTLWVAVITLWSGIEYFVKNGKCLKDM